VSSSCYDEGCIAGDGIVGQAATGIRSASNHRRRIGNGGAGTLWRGGAGSVVPGPSLCGLKNDRGDVSDMQSRCFGHFLRIPSPGGDLFVINRRSPTVREAGEGRPTEAVTSYEADCND
jgi:hypothetical protein